MFILLHFYLYSGHNKCIIISPLLTVRRNVGVLVANVIILVQNTMGQICSFQIIIIDCENTCITPPMHDNKHYVHIL